MKKGISRVFLKAISWQLSLAMLLSVLVFTPITASAATYDGKTDFMNGKYGIFLHYLPSGDSTDEQWINKVRSCDTTVVAAAAESAGASWVTLTLSQADGRYCIPINTIFANSDIAGYGSGSTKAVGVSAEDDLVSRLYDSLNAKGIKLMLYWIPGAPSNNDALAAVMGAESKVGGDWYLNGTLYQNQAAAMQTVSSYYGNKISGWWIDGCYDAVGFNETVANAESVALKSGNANAVIAFNNGTQYSDCRFACENYSAGEICHPSTLATTNIYNYSATGRWTDNGFQKHYLTFLGSNWGTQGAYYDTQQLVKHCYDNILGKGAAISFDVAVANNGTIDAAQLAQLQALKDYCNTSNLNMPLNFESGLNNALKYQDINYDTSLTIDNKEVELVSGENALNGDYSVVAKPVNNTRVDIVSKRDIAGNPDFSMTDFSKATGIMMRIKLSNGTQESTYDSYVVLRQNDKSTLWLCNGVKAYTADGTPVLLNSNNEKFVLPANFDGFLFLPFEASHDQNVINSAYGTFATDAGAIVNPANPYSFTLAMSGAHGATITLDDISYYQGAEDNDAWDTMRTLGYDIMYSRQPDTYTLPLDCEGYQLPIGLNTASRIYISNGGYPTEYINNIVSLVKGNEALDGNMSLKFTLPAVTESYITSEDDMLAKTMTGAMPLSGIEALSKEKLVAAANASKDNYAYLRMRVKVPEADYDYILSLHITQDGVDNNVKLASGAIGYDLNENRINLASDLNHFEIPSGFNGWIYIPFTKMATIKNNIYAGYYSETALPFMPDLSKAFEMYFELNEDTWSGISCYIDDISCVTGVSSLPYQFDIGLQRGFTKLNNAAAATTGLSYVNSGSALNGNGSMSIDFASGLSGNVTTNTVQVDGNSNFSWANIQAKTAKVDGIMMRIKTANATSTLPLSFIVQQGSKKTWLGRYATAYDLDGNLQTVTNGSFCTYLPANFDGYVFLPFIGARDNGWTSYSETGDTSIFVDCSSSYTMSFLFGNPYGNGTWSDVDLMLDDISYYEGDTASEYYNAIRSLGYEMLKADQPDTYSLPLDFEDYQLPFASMKSYCSADGSVSVNAASTVVGKAEALIGNASEKINVPATTTDTFIRAESTWSDFAGIDGLDKTTLKYANTDYASLRFRMKAPVTENNLPYHVNFSLTQDSAQANNANTGYLASGAHGYNADGSYNPSVSSWDRYIIVPSGFDGYIEVPVWNMFAVTADAYVSYTDADNQLPDLSQKYAMRFNTYCAGTGTFACASTDGVSFLIDDMSIKQSGKLGDVNSDGAVNATDLSCLRLALIGIGDKTEAMDLTGNKTVDLRDLVRLKKLLSAIGG